MQHVNAKLVYLLGHRTSLTQVKKLLINGIFYSQHFTPGLCPQAIRSAYLMNLTFKKLPALSVYGNLERRNQQFESVNTTYFSNCTAVIYMHVNLPDNWRYHIRTKLECIIPLLLTPLLHYNSTVAHRVMMVRTERGRVSVCSGQRLPKFKQTLTQPQLVPVAVNSTFSPETLIMHTGAVKHKVGETYSCCGEEN